MELSKWLKTDINEKLPILGKETFATFLKVCKEFSDWALDDIGLANRNNAYKIWVCKIQSNKVSKIKEILERYTSMKLLLHYFNVNIVENNLVALYIKLDYINNKWMMSYGITNNKKLFKVGEFEYTFNTELPENELLKYILEYIDDFNPREHLLLFKIKQDMNEFNPGYCQINDPQIINKEVLISTYDLGSWTDQGIVNGEPEKYLKIFKEWVATKKWSSAVEIVLRPKKNKWMDFVIRIK